MNIKFLTFFMMSVLLFSLKAEDTKISNCGNRLNIVMKYDPEKKSASLENFIFSNEQFCDLGTNETKANFDVILLDKNNKIVNQKSIYFNTMEVIESFKSRSSSQFGKTKLLQTPRLKISLRVTPTVRFSRRWPSSCVTSVQWKSAGSSRETPS